MLGNFTFSESKTCCSNHVCLVFWNFHRERFSAQLQRQKPLWAAVYLLQKVHTSTPMIHYNNNLSNARIMNHFWESLPVYVMLRESSDRTIYLLCWKDLGSVQISSHGSSTYIWLLLLQFVLIARNRNHSNLNEAHDRVAPLARWYSI